LWERPYYQQGAALERQIEDVMRSAADHRLFDDFTPEWVEFLRENLQVPALFVNSVQKVNRVSHLLGLGGRRNPGMSRPIMLIGDRAREGVDGAA